MITPAPPAPGWRRSGVPVRQRPPGSQVRLDRPEHHPRRRHPARTAPDRSAAPGRQPRAHAAGASCECQRYALTTGRALPRRAGWRRRPGPAAGRRASAMVTGWRAFTREYAGAGRHGAGVSTQTRQHQRVARAASARRRCRARTPVRPVQRQPGEELGRHATALAGVVVPADGTPRRSAAGAARRTTRSPHTVWNPPGNARCRPGSSRGWRTGRRTRRPPVIRQTTRPARTGSARAALTIGGQVKNSRQSARRHRGHQPVVELALLCRRRVQLVPHVRAPAGRA